MTDDLESLKIKYQNALAEIDKLRRENARLKQPATEPISSSAIKPKIKVHHPTSAPSKINYLSPVEERFHCLESFFVEERMSIQNVGNQETTILDIHRFAVMNGILLIVTNLA